MNKPSLSIIIPAHQEEARIGNCLESLLAQEIDPDIFVQVIVIANACTDQTVPIVKDHEIAFRKIGWEMQLLQLDAGGKILALNAGDAAASGVMRLYLDADIVAGPGLLRKLVTALDGAGPRYAGAKLRVPGARSVVSRLYARFWQKLPFVANNVTGAGLFALNADGRARWGQFPDIIADDGFARLNFSRAERICVDAEYDWPITEGLARLVKVRRRQDAGMAQIAELYPELLKNGDGDSPSRSTVLKLAFRDPVGFTVYSAVSILVRMRPASSAWTRGR